MGARIRIVLPDSLRWIDAWIVEWARWFRRDHREVERQCGYPKRSAGFSTGGSSSADVFEHMVDEADFKTVKAVDRCIGELDGQHYAALMNHYVGGLFNHRGDPAKILLEAVELVARMAEKKGVS